MCSENLTHKCPQISEKAAFSSSLLAGAPVNKESLAVFPQVFSHISESNFLIISMSRIRKMLTDVLKTRFFRFLLVFAPVNKEPLNFFAQVCTYL